MLRLFLFGPPRLERDGAPIPLGRSKALGLLAYLATTGQPQSRDALLALLWPEFGEADARNNLRRELSQLRGLLGEAVLESDRRQVRWASAPDRWVDSPALAAAIAAARLHGHTEQLCDRCATALSDVVGLAGDEFLAGYNLPDSAMFEEWLLFQREELRQQLGWALGRLARWHDEHGALDRALVLARRWQALDTLHEPPRRALMRLYARDGQLAAALRQYEEGARLLAAELGVEPEPETTLLYKAIRDRRSVPAPRSPLARQAESPQPTAAPARAIDKEQVPLTSFVGRAREVASLAARLADPACRLITLVGPGGIGKTRLAIATLAHAGQLFPDGAFSVFLSTVSSAEHIPPAIADALGLPMVGGDDAWEALAALLCERRQLLALDNLEQLLDAAPRLAWLLRAAPGLKLLVTSREALKLREEWPVLLEGLALPEDEDGASTAEAVQLFAERARQARADFALDAEREAVVRICRLVGGMPLAIELAAAWVASLDCAEIASSIDGNTALLATELRNVPARHRSLQAVLDQAWARLGPADQRVLARLSLFADSFTREGATAVAGADAQALSRLSGRGLLGRMGDRRYRLHPLVRSYAGQQLNASDEQAAEARAASGRYYSGQLCAEYQRQTYGAERASIAAMDAERGNLSSALPAVLEQTDDAAMRQVVFALFNFAYIRGLYREGASMLRQIEARQRQAQSRQSARLVLADALTGLGLIAVREGEVALASTQFVESATILAELGAPPIPGDSTDPCIGMGIVALIQGDYRAASRYAEQVRARSVACGLVANQAYAWYLLAEAAQAQGLLPAAHAAAARAIGLTRESGSEWFSAYVRNQLGQIALARGRYDEADAQFRAGYATREAFGDRAGMATALLNQGDTAMLRGDQHEAARLYAASLALLREVGDRGGTARALLGLGTLAIARGALREAWQQLQAALELANDLDYHHVALEIITHKAELLLAAGRPAEVPALLTLALLHRAGRSATTARAQQLLARCEELLSADVFAKEVRRGHTATLERMVEQLLGSAPPLGT